MKSNFRNDLPIVNLYKRKYSNSKIETQLLFGDDFKVIKNYTDWKKIKIKSDGYTGFIKKKKFSKIIKPNYKVSVLKARLFSNPSINKKLKIFIPYQARLKVIEKKNKFSKFDKYWIKNSDLSKNNLTHRNVFKDIKIFRNIKYLWGGKSYKGIDCSALVQIFFNYNNKYCPRDSVDQERYFKKKVSLKNIKKNDMIFWKGHVAIAISKYRLIHAYGPKKKVVEMNINKTIERIKKTANLNVTSIRRI